MTSVKDQKHYWIRDSEPYQYLTVEKFSEAFHAFHVGQIIPKALEIPFEKKQSLSPALTSSKYGVSKRQLVNAISAREVLLMRRNSSLYIVNFVHVSSYTPFVTQYKLFLCFSHSFVQDFDHSF